MSDVNVNDSTLAARGIVWPLCGYAPGRYTQTCTRCGSRHEASKRSTRCLPCAITTLAEAAADVEAARREAFVAGRQSVIDAVAGLNGRTLIGGLLDEAMGRTPAS